MAEINEETVKEVVRLRDEEEMGWKEISFACGFAGPNGSPKKAKRLYEQGTGKPATTSTSRKGTGTGKGKKGQEGETAKTARTKSASPIFFEDEEEDEVAGRISNKTVVVQYLPDGHTGIRRVVEYDVRKVTDFGWSGKSGTRWVRFIDKDQKSRTIPTGSIVGIK